MKNFMWNIRCMILAKKYAKSHEQCRHEYNWYRYLVKHDINSFFSRLNPFKKDELPF